MSRNLETQANDWRRFGTPEDHVGFLLKTLHHGLRQVLEVELRKRRVPLSFAQVAAMFNLLLEPGLTGAQLARRTTVSAQTMNTILRRLEADGFIERRPHPESRRADSWFLRAAGHDVLGQARVVGEAVFARMLATLSAKEVEELRGYLRRCIAALDVPVVDRTNEGPAPRRSAARRRGRRDAAVPLRKTL